MAIPRTPHREPGHDCPPAEADASAGGSPARSSRRRRRVARQRGTLFGTVEVMDTVDGLGRAVRILEVDHSWQSAMFLDQGWSELVFPYHRVFNLAVAQRRPRRVLMLGGGAYSYPKYLLCHLRDIQVDVVEVDPVICDIARQWFYLDRVEGLLVQEGRPDALRTFICDGRDFLELGAPDDADARYDLIANDCFQGTDPASGLMTQEAARLARRRLSPRGTYVANLVGCLEGGSASVIHDVCHTFSQVFAHVWLLPCGPDDPRIPANYVMVATDTAGLDFPQALDLEGLGATGRAPAPSVLTDADFMD